MLGTVAVGENFFDLECVGVGSSHDGTHQRDWTLIEVLMFYMKCGGRNHRASSKRAMEFPALEYPWFTPLHGRSQHPSNQLLRLKLLCLELWSCSANRLFAGSSEACTSGFCVRQCRKTLRLVFYHSSGRGR